MIADFVLVGGWIFWGVIAVFVLVEVVVLTYDAEDTAFPVSAALVVAIFLGLFTNAPHLVTWRMLAGCIAGYVVCGVVWSIKKWYSFVMWRAADLREIYNAHVNTTVVGNETFASYAANKQPTAADNKQRIVTWMVLWPFSLAWWCLTWPRRVFNWIYEWLTTFYDRVSAAVWVRLVR